MSKPIRVLQVFAQMNRGGAETMIMNLYRNIDRSKIQFDFIVHTEEKCDFDDEIYKLGGRIFRVPAYKGKNHINYWKSWRDFFNDHPEYNIIHGHVRSTAAIYLRIAKKYGLTTIAHSHNISSGNGFSALIKNLLQYPIRYVADYLFACSKAAGKWLFGTEACKKSNFHILNNAIDVKDFTFNKEVRKKKRKEFGIEDRFVIGHVGRFHPQKNHDFIVDIFKSIHDRYNNAVLLLVGDGELRQTMERKVNELGLSDQVIFTGVRSDIPELMQTMDLFLFPSLYEGLGIVVVEAQAAGLHCIVSKTIPKEVYITDLVKSISLKQKAEEWADEALKIAEFDRLNFRDTVKSSGYDITETTKWVENFYLQVGLE
ncbi:MAG TPA: glycosyltransferase family 1 protein [Candidatus Avamphibacillus sp.]|nr:glycosyltransferase family 1 protein [Candidatus Avamphibacillus sp.]